MIRIHELLRAGRYPNCSSLAEEFEYSARTATRDLDFMKYRLELPIEYDPRRKGYYYEHPVERLPAVAMSEAELFAFLVAHKAITQYQGTPFQHPLETAFRKLTSQLDRRLRFTLGNLDELLSFRPFAPEDADLAAFQVIARALRQGRAMTFRYRNLGAPRARCRRVYPYHLACIDNQWYLFAYDLRRRDLRTFLLTRLRAPQITGQRFAKPRHFDLNQYLRGSFNVYRGRGDYELVLEFDAWAADLIRGRRWHASQELTELAGGKVRLRLRLSSLKEAERWVLGWGTHATVRRPKALAARLFETARALCRRYQRAIT